MMYDDHIYMVQKWSHKQDWKNFLNLMENFFIEKSLEEKGKEADGKRGLALEACVMDITNAQLIMADIKFIDLSGFGIMANFQMGT